MHTYNVEFTDTFGGEANYCWVKRASVQMPELTAFGYDASANRRFERQLMRKAKASVGLTGMRGRKESWGDIIVFYPCTTTVMFVNYAEDCQ